MKYVKYITLPLLIFSSSFSFAMKMEFDSKCDYESQVTVGAVGDFLMHDPLQKKANVERTFKNIWRKFQSYSESVDFMYGNLETPTAPGLSLNLTMKPMPESFWDNDVFTSYPRFNTHPQLVTDIKLTGFDIVSTANNHVLDRGYLGVDLSIKELKEADLKFSGTRMSTEKNNQWATVIERKGWKIAFISCTFSLNGSRDKFNQVLLCDKNYSQIKEEMLSLKNSVDAIIVTPHWGEENQNIPNAEQFKYGHQFIEDGATAVLGAHPHVLQPMEKVLTKDGREGFVMYSLANFISFQPRVQEKSTVMMFVTLKRDHQNRVKIAMVEYIPAYMKNRTGNFRDVEVLPVTKEWGMEGWEHITKILPAENAISYGTVPGLKKLCGK